jgi:hypothetical protein
MTSPLPDPAPTLHGDVVAAAEPVGSAPEISIPRSKQAMTLCLEGGRVRSIGGCRSFEQH